MPDQPLELPTAPAIADVGYYASPPNTYATERCRLDVWIPQAPSFPVVLFFHGGGLTEGGRNDCLPLTRSLLKGGIGVVLADYRLTPRAETPAFIEDAAAAAAWTLAHAGDFGGDPNAVFCGGYSAGSYLAAMVMQDSSYLDAFGGSRDRFAGLIAVSGQMVTHRCIRERRGGPPERPVIDEYAPLHHAWRPSPPALCVAADNDNPARLEENLYWMAIRRIAGCTGDRTVIVPGRNHGTIVNATDATDEPVPVAIGEFIQSVRTTP